MRYRLILPDYLKGQHGENKDILEFEKKDITEDKLVEYNEQGYNVYYFPNYNSKPLEGNYLSGKDVDIFKWCFIDMDLKDGIYESIQEFGKYLKDFPLAPTKTISTGHGVHCYWKLSNLTREKYIELQLKLIKHFKTDNSVWTVLQLMRHPDYMNTKDEDDWIYPEVSQNEDFSSYKEYSIQMLELHLPELDDKDKEKIKKHIDKLNGIKTTFNNVEITDLPEKFEKMLEKNEKLYDWFYNPHDRSVADMKIANIIQLSGFTEDEAINILLHTNKGQERGIGYVEPIIRKVYDNPMTMIDREFYELNKIAHSVHFLEEMKHENTAYKIEKENKKIKMAKKLELERGKFTLEESNKWRLMKLIQDTQDDMEFTGKELPFIGKKLSKCVSLCGKDYVFIGGLAGRGKSSCVANITLPVLKQNKKVLVLSTEESATEHIKRIMGLELGYDFGNEKTWSDHQRMNILKQYREKYIDQLVVLDYLDKTKDGIKANLCYKEGLENVLEGVRNDGFDLIILDYFTKITSSMEFPDMKFNIVLEDVAKYLEEYNKQTKIPIIVFGQLHSQKGDSEFKDRIRGSKSIFEYVTTAIEAITDTEAGITTMKFHKIRKIPSNFRWSVDLEYVKGKYIEID